MKLHHFARIAHRWLSYVIALQVLAWVLGGLVFAWLPFQPWVKAADFAGKPSAALPTDWPGSLQAAVQAQPLDAPLRSVSSVPSAAGMLWRLQPASGAVQWRRADGAPWQPVQAAQVERYARQLYKGPGQPVGAAQQLDQVSPRLGLVQEMGERRGLWRVSFDDAQSTRLYFDGASGEFIVARTEAWVWYDLLWRLHIMDYSGGEDFNNPLLRGAAPLAFLLVLAGLVLTVQAAWRARRRPRSKGTSRI